MVIGWGEIIDIPSGRKNIILHKPKVNSSMSDKVCLCLTDWEWIRSSTVCTILLDIVGSHQKKETKIICLQQENEKHCVIVTGRPLMCQGTL